MAKNPKPLRKQFAKQAKPLPRSMRDRLWKASKEGRASIIKQNLALFRSDPTLFAKGTTEQAILTGTVVIPDLPAVVEAMKGHHLSRLTRK